MHTKGERKDKHPLDSMSKSQEKNGNGKMKKDTKMWCEFHKIPWHNTNEYCTNHSLMAKMKTSDLDLDFDSDP